MNRHLSGIQIIFSIGFLLVTNTGFTQPSKQVLFDINIRTFNAGYDEPLELIGNVHTMKETHYLGSEKNGEIVKGKIILDPTLITMNEKGKISTKESFDKNGNILRTWSYSYDENGNNITKTLQSFEKGSTTITQNYEYSYNSTGKWIYERGTRNNEEISTTKFEYDKDGNWITAVFKESPTYGGLQVYAEALYTNGVLNIIKLGEIAGEFKTKQLYTYDAKGNLIDFSIYGFANNIKCQQRVYTYDDNNRLIKDSIGFDAAWVTTTNKYDVAGNLIETYIIDETNARSRINYTCNEKNMLIEKTYQEDESAPSTYTYSYTFDSHGNWIQTVTKTAGKVTEIKERLITYW
jgi:hypothetical protein